MSETEAASSLYFVDTNIWLYAFIAGQDTAKSARAKQLLQAELALTNLCRFSGQGKLITFQQSGF
jgi:hypothetical protein